MKYPVYIILSVKIDHNVRSINLIFPGNFGFKLKYFDGHLRMQTGQK